ncbi:mycothiol synthase [Glaciihabitans sp. dw_435]|uniref:mycothiol synthase n=1 Tax=Glaciihabitans sp. dw_435 TaxID=2720081 RepID=UPI001BD21EEC|nr:mycothiol synthase [Glaciihabitans sp. dw_435]
MSDSTPSVPDWFAPLVQRARATDGQPPFSDQSLVDLRTGERELISIGTSAVALASATEAEFVVDPDARGAGLGTQLLDRLLAHAHPSTGLLVWAHGDHPAARALASSHGLTPVRELLHLRMEMTHPAAAPAPAPADAPAAPASSPPLPHDARLSTFRVGTDEAAWLDLNARAFAHHAEQGSVTRTDLDELIAEPWFRADDFLLLHIGDELVGYCWLKVEGDSGEFYVVGVDPDSQGMGLGRILTTAGLTRLRQRDIRFAHLYVEGDNTAAVRLYRSLGFTDDSIDIQYRAPAR